MGVNNNIGAHTIDGERHVAFGDDVTYGTLLPVTRREFVTDNGFTGSADADFCDTISVAVAVDDAGGWSFIVSPSAQSGTWLPTGSVPKFDLTLRLYHPSATTIQSPETAQLPTIERKECV